LVTNASFARFQHASDPCPLADTALFLDVTMRLVERNETKRLAEVQAATGQVRLRSAVTASNLKQIPAIRTRKLAEFSECSARSAAMPAPDLRRGRRAFRAIEDDAEGVTLDADNSKARMPDRCLRNLRGF
jgi:hypothetical protein